MQIDQVITEWDEEEEDFVQVVDEEDIDNIVDEILAAIE